MKKYSFQVNLHFGKNEIFARCILGACCARNIGSLLKKIQEKFDLKIEQIVLTFQPND